MILVAAGTHHQPFDRLVRAADALARAVADEVVLQRGVSRVPAPSCRVVDHLCAFTFEEHLRLARVVVLHAGSSSFLQARSLGRVPIVVPRRPDHGEHVDDHQVRFAAGLGHEAVVVEPEHLLAAVAAHADGGATGDPQVRSRRFAEGLEHLVADLVQRR